MSLLVGCPVRDRAWILPHWIQAVENAGGHAGMDVAYLFVVDPADPTFEVIERFGHYADVRVVMIEEEPLDPAARGRGWNIRARREHMVEVRNELLIAVRAETPDLFWSLDSDILVPPLALKSASEMLADGYGAVATLTWMSGHTCDYPNFGTWDPSNGGLRRWRTEPGIRYPADIVMAAKLMTPAAYQVDYCLPDGWQIGEDVGWSLACRAAGVKLGIDGHHPAKHVMGPDLLDVVDPRIGW